MTIQDDFQANLAAIRDDLVHALDRCQSLKVWILRIIDAICGCTRFEHFIREWKPQRVEPKLFDLIENGFVSTRPESVQYSIASLESKPIHSADSYCLSTRVDNLISSG